METWQSVYQTDRRVKTPGQCITLRPTSVDVARVTCTRHQETSPLKLKAFLAFKHQRKVDPRLEDKNCPNLLRPRE